MKLETYLAKLPRGGKARFARQLGIAPSGLSRLLSGDRPITPSRALAIEKATAGAVTRKDTRPDDWIDHWPELAAQNSNINQGEEPLAA